MKEGGEEEEPNRKGDGKGKCCKKKREDFMEIISKIARQIYEQIAEFFEKWISIPAGEDQLNDGQDTKKSSDICEEEGKTQGNKDEEETREGKRDELPDEKPDAKKKKPDVTWR